MPDQQIYILYDNRFLSRFDREVVPVLRIRGIKIEESDDAIRNWLVNWFEPTAAIWGARIKVPQKDKVYWCRPKCSQEDCVVVASLFDLRVRADFPSKEIGENVLVKVQRTWGLTAYAERQGMQKDEIQPKPGIKTLVLLSNQGVTVMIEMLDKLACFVAWDVWADEKLPFDLLSQRPETPLRGGNYPIKWQYQSGETCSFAVECPKCESKGQIQCGKCDGSGYLASACIYCAGSGKRDETNGSRSDCYRCKGRGTVTKECRACNKTGIITCPQCKGHGKASVRYNDEKDAFHLSFHKNDGTQTEPELILDSQVFLFDFVNKMKLEVDSSGASQLVKDVEALTSAHLARIAAIKRFCAALAPIESCLDFSLKASGTIKREPISLQNPESTTERRKGKIIYAFSLVPPVEKWMKAGEVPFPYETPLNISPAPQCCDARGDSSPPVLHGIDFEARKVLLRFPVTIDRKSIEDQIEIAPFIAKPSEKTQKAHLMDWIGLANHRTPIFEAMASGFPKFSTQAVELFKLEIAKWPSQQKAVEIGCGDAPLFLIKGPPGTGKTTVIVEIVRQTIKQGGKVLVCSQTHQAVRNVLERLHDVGGIPMLRYSRDESKLSELERRYCSSVSASETNKILNQARQALREAKDMIRSLTADMETLSSACERVAALASFRDEKASERRRVKQSCLAEELEWNSQMDADEKTFTLQFDAKKTTLHAAGFQAFDSMSKAFTSFMDYRNDYFDLSQRLAGKDVNPTGEPKSLLSMLGQVIMDELPRAIASDESLARRCKDAKDKYNMFEMEYDAQMKKHKAIMVELDDLSKEHEGWMKCAKSMRNVRLCQIAQRSQDKLDSIARELHETEARHAEELKDATTLAMRHGLRTDHDFFQQAWSYCLASAQKSLKEWECKLTFCKEWTRSLGDNLEALDEFLDQQIKVFFSTCVGLASWKHMESRKVDLVIIDEAGHATIPETIVPLSFAKRAILIGDERQLPPIVVNDLECLKRGKPGKADAQCVRNDDHCWLKHSMFAQLWEDSQLDIPRVMLDMQFRMHPDIGRFVSDAFYEGKLKNGICADSRTFRFGEFKRPLCIVSTSAYGNVRFEREDGQHSWYNELEVQMVCRIIEHLLDHLKGETQEGEIDVGIISHYAAQTRLLQKKLDPLTGTTSQLKLEAEDIASVDKYQGSERDIIIASFVRSPDPNGRKRNLGFVQDLKRMNVAFSRARKMLIMVGDIDALCEADGSEDGREVLRQFRDYVSDRGRVLHVWERRAGRHG